MKETFFTNLIELAFTIASAILVPMLASWLRSKTQNEKLKSMISDVEHAVKTCVDFTEQTLVQKLKESGEWTAESKKTVLLDTVTDAIDMLLDSTRSTLEANSIDIESFITAKIEAYIQSKKITAKAA
jgi:hypothetical protein